MKEEEMAGTIKWLDWEGNNYKPKCANKVNWDTDTWDCSGAEDDFFLIKSMTLTVVQSTPLNSDPEQFSIPLYWA